MAILKDPLFSDEAHGQVAKVAVFKRSQVHPVLCSLAYHPQNWTPPHVAQARAWRALCSTWRSLTFQDQEAWRTYAPGVLTGFNFFIQCNGHLSLPPCYVPPPAHSLLFDLTDSPYYPPDSLAISFIQLWCI